MRILTKLLIKRLSAPLFLIFLFGLVILLSWMSANRYQEKLSIYRDTLLLNHHYSSVKVSYTGTILIRGIGRSTYTVDLSGAAATRPISETYAKNFVDGVLSPSLFYADTIYINYCTDNKVFRQYAFSKTDLSN